MTKITADFECANAEYIQKIGDNHFSLKTRADNAKNGGGYANCDYYVAFRIWNDTSSDREIAVDIIFRNSKLTSEGYTIGIRKSYRNKKAEIYDWKPLAKTKIQVIKDKGMMRVILKVKAHSCLDVTTMYWMPFSEVENRLKEMAESNFLKLQSIGKTLQKRDIWTADLSPDDKKDIPVCIIGATPQSHELGTIAVMGILEKLFSERPKAILNKYRIIALPVSNPDGNALGTCMTNSNYENIIFGFDKVNTDAASFECESIWGFVTNINPAFYLEYHSYLHENRPSFRAYEFDQKLFPDEESRRRGELFFKTLRGNSPNPPYVLPVNSEGERNNRSTLNSRLIIEKGITATTYKLHNRETIIKNIDHAYHIFKAIIKAMERKNVN